MTVASPDVLHRIVHRAAFRPRDEDDWWGSPIDSALGAVAAARHQRAFRSDAVRAVARLERWWSGGEARPVSADVVALALTARAKAELQQQDVQLTTAAVAAVDGLAARDPSLAPELHLALCAWALDRLVSDRDQAPWPALRQRFERSRGYGVEEPLRRYGSAVAAVPFDAVGVTQALLGEVGSSPSPSDSVILIWLLGATIERVSEVLPQTDSGLRVLVEQRGGLVERLAGEVDEQTFVEPAISGFDPDVTEGTSALTYLSPMEALLLDVSLASREAETPWLTFAEADQLFGERADAAGKLVASTRRGFAAKLAALAFAVAVLTGVVAGLVGNLAGLDLWVTVNAGVAVGGAVAFVFVLFLNRVAAGGLTDAAGLFTGMVALVAAIDAGNQARKHPFLPDAAGVTLSIVVPAAAAALWFGLKQLRDD
jgi:hypothetical protein